MRREKNQYTMRLSTDERGNTFEVTVLITFIEAMTHPMPTIRENSIDKRDRSGIKETKGAVKTGKLFAPKLYAVNEPTSIHKKRTHMSR